MIDSESVLNYDMKSLPDECMPYRSFPLRLGGGGVQGDLAPNLSRPPSTGTGGSEVTFTGSAAEARWKGKACLARYRQASGEIVRLLQVGLFEGLGEVVGEGGEAEGCRWDGAKGRKLHM